MLALQDWQARSGAIRGVTGRDSRPDSRVLSHCCAGAGEPRIHWDGNGRRSRGVGELGLPRVLSQM